MAVNYTDQVHSSVHGRVLRYTFVNAVKSLTAWIIDSALGGLHSALWQFVILPLANLASSFTRKEQR